MRGRTARSLSTYSSSRCADMSKAGSSEVRNSASRTLRRRSCAPSSMGEPHTTTSGSPISPSHQRVARHLAATSWLTRSLPSKYTSGSPLEPPVLKRASCRAWVDVNRSLWVRMRDMVSKGSLCRSSKLVAGPTQHIFVIRHVTVRMAQQSAQTLQPQGVQAFARPPLCLLQAAPHACGIVPFEPLVQGEKDTGDKPGIEVTHGRSSDDEYARTHRSRRPPCASNHYRGHGR